MNYELTKGEFMKKKIAIILSVVLVFIVSSVLVIALTRKHNNVIRVNEVTHSIFYAPFYIAINNGYFAEEDITLELTNGGGSNNSMNALLSGEADIALLGPEAIVYVATGQALDQPIMFAQLTKKDGSLLISKTQTNNFQWEDLIGKTIIGGRKGGVPAMTLQYVIEVMAGLEIGTDPDQVNLRTDVEFNLTASTYEQEGDYCTLFEPSASALIAANKGYRVASIGSESGEIPYTGFAAKQSYLSKNQYVIKRFIRAVIRGYDYLMTANIDDVVDALAPSFATTSKESIKAAMQTYIEIEAWAETPIMKQVALNYLQTVMIHAGELVNRVEYSKVFDPTFAESVLDEMAA